MQNTDASAVISTLVRISNLVDVCTIKIYFSPLQLIAEWLKVKLQL